MHTQKHTEETKQKISIAKRGQVFGHKWEKGYSPWNKGHTAETDQRVRKYVDKHKLAVKGQKAWNKGLTKETDERVKKYSNTLCNVMNRPDIKIKYTGENTGNYIDGRSYLPYCNKFNNKFKEAIRIRDDQICQLCGMTQENNKEKLSVHHIHYDKSNCYPDCVALCRKCNSIVNFNREFYEELFTFKLWIRNLLYWKPNTVNTVAWTFGMTAEEYDPYYET